MRLHPLSLSVTALAVFLAACSSTPVAEPPKPVAAAPAPAPAPAAPAPAPAAPAPQVTPVTLPAYLDPQSPISRERSVYFDFDDFTVKKDYTALIERQGSYLAANPKLAIKVEGNADERGSSEYNLALGQKRAQAVATALKVYGVKEPQMEVVSWGKERPADPGHTEAAWAKNRRADIVYPKQ